MARLRPGFPADFLVAIMCSEKTPDAAAEGLTEKGPNRMWGGRFASAPDTLMEGINASIDFDKQLFRQDIAGSRAHAEMLAAVGILSQEDVRAILDGLDLVVAEFERGEMSFRTELEDIHMNIEARLAELIGDAAGRLHTARSRNDQVATDFRLWLRDRIDETLEAVRDLQEALINQAERHADGVMPGFTHLQAAQPITVGHHLLAYVEMFGRDLSRVRDARARMNESSAWARRRWPARLFRSTGR